MSYDLRLPTISRNKEDDFTLSDQRGERFINLAVPEEHYGGVLKYLADAMAQVARPTPTTAPFPAKEPDAPPPTIAIGQTEDQVTEGFGQPLRVAKVGVKVIFYYKDMKVTFTSGKVSNVE